MPELNIITVDEAKDALGLVTADQSQDQRINRLITQATRRMETYLGNYLLQRTGVVEKFFGQGPRIWFLRFYPVATLTSIVDPAGNAMTAADDYILEEETGQIHSRRGRFAKAVDSAGATDRWSVTYDAGRFATVDDVGEEFKDAATILVCERFERPEPGVISRRFGDTTVTYTKGGELVPQEVQDLIGGYVSRST